MKTLPHHYWFLLIGFGLILGSVLVPQSSVARLLLIIVGLLCVGATGIVRRYSK
jgi:hypothetical protein